jgi:hypothetical protein
LILWMLQLMVYWKKIVKLFLIYLGLASLPMASAQSDLEKFPDIAFKVFNDFVQQQFGREVSLATVLTVLFTLTSNPELLGLHARQQHPKVQGEIRQSLSGWIKVLSLALQNQLGEAVNTLVDEDAQNSVMDALAAKLHNLSKLLDLDPYMREDRGTKLKPIDENDIAPARVICPLSTECETDQCQSQGILKYTKDQDLSYATLISGAGKSERALVVAGQCSRCKRPLSALYRLNQRE